ncbi:MAG: hypothetical protein Q9217_006603 [Psora testacea]
MYASAQNEHLPAHPAPDPPLEYTHNGFAVQSLMLLAISYHMSNNPQQAQDSLDKATDIALNIGLHRNDFAVAHGNGVPSIEESWRRTWWELYILDVMFAALNQMTVMRLKATHADVSLPCEEHTYRNEDYIPPGRALSEFDRRFLAEEDVVYSSFCYRIAATRALSQIISVSIGQQTQTTPCPKEAEFILENLILHLPKSMQTIFDTDESVNEMLFQTHMLIHAPRSALASSAPSTIACVPNPATLHTSPMLYHTKKTVDAANEICHMISMSSPLLLRTPFFTCAVALQALVHLSAYDLPQYNHKRLLTTQQLQMSLGALRRLSELWPMANTVLKLVKDMARAVLHTSPDSSTPDNMADVAPAQQILEQAAFDDTSSIGFNSLSQANDDAWFDEFPRRNLGDSAVPYAARPYEQPAILPHNAARVRVKVVMNMSGLRATTNI